MTHSDSRVSHSVLYTHSHSLSLRAAAQVAVKTWLKIAASVFLDLTLRLSRVPAETCLYVKSYEL